MKKLIFLLSMLMLVNLASAQQGNFINRSGSSNIPGSMSMEVTSGAITIAPFITQFDLEGGLETSAVRFTIKSNKDWKLATEIGAITSNPLAGGAGPASITSPLTYNHFRFYTTAADNEIYSNMTAFPGAIAYVKTGFKGNIQKSGNTFNLKFKIIPGFEVDPASYTIPLIYTLSAQ